MLGDMRKYVKFGLEALSAQASDDIGKAMRSRGQGLAEQLSALAAGFLEWSAEARASLRQELRDVVARQVEEMGVATRKDLAALRGRIDRLESELRGMEKATKTARSARAGKSGSTGTSKASSGRTRASRGRG